MPCVRSSSRIAEGQPASRPPPRGFLEFRAHVAEPKPGARTPGALAREALGAATDAAALARATELVRGHEVGPWPTAAPVLEKVAERIGELAKSPLVISPAARREQAQSLLAEAQGEVFAEPVGRLHRAAIRGERLRVLEDGPRGGREGLPRRGRMRFAAGARRRTRWPAPCSRRCWLPCSPVWKSRRRARRSPRCS